MDRGGSEGRRAGEEARGEAGDLPVVIQDATHCILFLV